MYRLVLWSGRILLAIGVLLILLGWAGALMSQGIVGGMRQILEWLNPFNIWNFLATVAVLSPGLALLAWAQRLAPDEERSDT